MPVLVASGYVSSVPSSTTSCQLGKRCRSAPPKTFQCRGYGDCRMVFSRSEHLARHIRKHTSECPFTCHCSKQFSHLDNLRQHAQTVHADKQEANERMMRELTTLHAVMDAVSKAGTGNSSMMAIKREPSLFDGFQDPTMSMSQRSSPANSPGAIPSNDNQSFRHITDSPGFDLSHSFLDSIPSNGNHFRHITDSPGFDLSQSFLDSKPAPRRSFRDRESYNTINNLGLAADQSFRTSPIPNSVSNSRTPSPHSSSQTNSPTSTSASTSYSPSPYDNQSFPTSGSHSQQQSGYSSYSQRLECAQIPNKSGVAGDMDLGDRQEKLGREESLAEEADSKKHYLKARTVSASIWTNPPPHSASPPASISTLTKYDDGETSLQHFQGSLNQSLNANSDSNSEAINAICGSQCQPDEVAFTEQRIFYDTTTQQLKSRTGLLDICQEFSAPPLLISEVGEAGPSHSEEGHEERSHSEPDCLVEQPIVLPPPSFAIERKLGSFDQSCAPGSCPEPVGEVPDPQKNFGQFLGITTPQIPARHFSSEWILSVHRDWGWLLNNGGEMAPAPDKHNISRFISRLLAEWTSSSPGTFDNANGFAIHGSSLATAQNVHYTTNNYWPSPTGDSGQSLRDLQQQIEQLQKQVKQLHDELMLSRRNEDRTEHVLSELSDIWQSLHRLETRLPPEPEPPPDKPERLNESTDENNYMQLPEGFQLHPSGFPSDGGSKDELLSRMEKQSDMLMEIIKANQRKEEETLSRIEQLLTTKLEPPLDSMVTIENYQMHTGTNPPLDHDDPNSTPTAEDRIRQLERQVEEQKLIIQQKDLENKNLRSSNHETLQRIEERLPPEPEPLPDRRYYDNSSSSNHQAYPSSHRQERFDNHPISLSRSHPQFEHHRPSGPSCISPDTSISHHHHPTNAGHPGPQRHLLARETDYGNQLRNGRTNHRPSSRTRRFRPYHGHDDPRTDSYSSPRHHSRERHSHRHFSR